MLHRTRHLAAFFLFVVVGLVPQTVTAWAQAPIMLAINEETSFRFEVLGQYPLFQLKAPGDGALRVEIVASPTDRISPYPIWQSEKGQVVRRGEEDIRIEGGQTVLLALHSHFYENRAYVSQEPVRFRVRYLPLEPVDRGANNFAQASLLAIDEETSFRFLVRGEQYYFRIKAPADGALRMEVTRPPVHGGPYPKWLDAKGNVLRTNEFDIGAKAGQELILELSSSRYSSREYASESPVGFRVRFAPRVPSDRGATSAGEATPLAIDEETSLRFLVRGERYFFRVATPVAGALRFELTSPPARGGPYLRWHDAKGNALRTGEWDIAADAGQTYLLEVGSARYESQEYVSEAVVRFRLRLVPRPVADPGGTSHAEAVSLAIGQVATFQFLILHEDRYFRIEPPGEGALHVEILDSPKERRAPVVVWLDKAGNQLRTGAADLLVRSREPVVLRVSSGRYPSEAYVSNDPVRLRAGFIASTASGNLALARRIRLPLAPGQTRRLVFAAPAAGTFLAEADPASFVTLAWQGSDGKPLGEGPRATLGAAQLGILQVRAADNADVTHIMLVVRAIAGPAANLAMGGPQAPPALRPVEHVGAW
ncbi:MAG: hypothetical protein K2Y71_15835 [Xanthobacteraceae bacterium]|nr:hypothetical protein [Xanthobacteraceae bacterium]